MNFSHHTKGAYRRQLVIQFSQIWSGFSSARRWHGPIMAICPLEGAWLKFIANQELFWFGCTCEIDA